MSVPNFRTHLAEYRAWSAMKARCLNQNSPSFKNYGGRGITIDPSWNKFSTFATDMGARPEGYTLERVDNNGPYCAANCRWATRLEQAQNKRNTVIADGTSLRSACAKRGISYNAVKRRLKRGWDLDLALSKPIGARKIHADQVTEIAEMRRAGSTVAEIARKFGISPALASTVSRRVVWATS